MVDPGYLQFQNQAGQVTAVLFLLSKNLPGPVSPVFKMWQCKTRPRYYLLVAHGNGQHSLQSQNPIP